MYKLALFLFFTATLARAQIVDLDKDRSQLVEMNGKWHFHAGDDPDGSKGWSSPALDDAAWPLLDANRSWYEQGYPGLNGYAWYRFTVRVPAGSGPVSLLLPPIRTSYTLFSEGRRIGGYGDTSSQVWFQTPDFALFQLTSASELEPRTIHLAVRVWHSPVWSSYAPGGPRSTGVAGNIRLIDAFRQGVIDRSLSHNVDQYVDTILRVVIGLLILVLFLLRPQAREYLWFALIQFFGAASDLLEFLLHTTNWISIPLTDLLDDACSAGFWIAGMYFFAAILAARKGRWFQGAQVLCLLSPLTIAPFLYGWVPVPVASALNTTMTLPALFWVLSLLIGRAVKGNADARLLLAPTLLVHGFYVVANAIGEASQLSGAYFDLFQWRVPLVPFDFGLYTLLNILFLMALMVYLVRRFSQGQQREERYASELEAAATVQQVLVPTQNPSIPGFAIEAVYKPAGQVGGDLYQIVPTASGGVLILVGDVSGKGMPAAMTVSLLVGAFHTLVQYTQSPAEILAAMNLRMLGRSNGGFTTCLVLRVDSDGVVTAANGGHIAPYLDGKEILLENGLPLGLTADSVYAETSLTLPPEAQLTVMTDGVLEAQTSSGELFGFDRTAAISTQSAEVIAKAAQVFGQEDDITVLTLTYTGAEVPHA